eukprot:6801562-Prymnesium_polylepis.2
MAAGTGNHGHDHGQDRRYGPASHERHVCFIQAFTSGLGSQEGFEQKRPLEPGGSNRIKRNIQQPGGSTRDRVVQQRTRRRPSRADAGIHCITWHTAIPRVLRSRPAEFVRYAVRFMSVATADRARKPNHDANGVMDVCVGLHRLRADILYMVFAMADIVSIEQCDQDQQDCISKTRRHQ